MPEIQFDGFQLGLMGCKYLCWASAHSRHYQSQSSSYLPGRQRQVKQEDGSTLSIKATTFTFPPFIQVTYIIRQGNQKSPDLQYAASHPEEDLLLSGSHFFHPQHRKHKVEQCFLKGTDKQKGIFLPQENKPLISLIFFYVLNIFSEQCCMCPRISQLLSGKPGNPWHCRASYNT